MLATNIKNYDSCITLPACTRYPGCAANSTAFLVFSVPHCARAVWFLASTAASCAALTYHPALVNPVDGKGRLTKWWYAVIALDWLSSCSGDSCLFPGYNTRLVSFTAICIPVPWDSLVSIACTALWF